MATIVKLWDNGDELTLVTSGSGISISSDPNLTGAVRQKTVRIQTTNEGTKAYHDLVISQGIQSAVQDGYWVHKDTNAVTYFGADADFITNGVMSRPSWIANAKEIRLCTGITEFEVTHYSDPEWGDWEQCDVFMTDYDINFPELNVYASNSVIEKLDFGNAEIESIPNAFLSLVQYNNTEMEYQLQTPFSELVFNTTVKHYGPYILNVYMNVDIVITMPTTPVTISGDTFINVSGTNKMIFRTPYANMASLANVLANAQLETSYTIQGY